MKICFLTQTATDISDYYKEYFKNEDLYFITFKKENPNAVGFLPKSSWSEGRNRLWDEVKGKYDYYIFMDDDLNFCKLRSKIVTTPVISNLYLKFNKNGFPNSYKSVKNDVFFSTLRNHLELYKPEIGAVTQLDGNAVNGLDLAMLKKGASVRRIGFFDAQFTIMSNYAANKILPYDTKISGWVSAQILVYLYSFYVFKSKALSILSLGVKNSYHVGAYTPNYDGIADCRKMITAINESTGKNYDSLSGKFGGVDYLFGKEEILKHIPFPNSKENYKANFNDNLKGLESFFHENLGFL